ncbi:MAG: PEP-CTERM sorting domain-containing protein [Verrucomicrobiota bacterium]
MKIKSILFAIAGLALSTAAHATTTLSGSTTTLFNTTTNPIQFGGEELSEGNTLSQSFTVPVDTTWTFDFGSVDIGQGSEANFELTIYDSSNNLVATSNTVAFTVLFDFVNVPLTFSSPVTLTAGDYTFRNNYTITGSDYTSFWGGDNSGNLSVSLGVIPEPSAFALLGLGAVGLVARRRRSA